MIKDNSLDNRYRKIIFHLFLGLPGMNHLTKLSVVKPTYMIMNKLLYLNYQKPVIPTSVKFCKTLLYLLGCQMLAKLCKFLNISSNNIMFQFFIVFFFTSLLTEPSPSLSMFLKTFSSGVSSPINSPNERRPS